MQMIGMQMICTQKIGIQMSHNKVRQQAGLFRVMVGMIAKSMGTFQSQKLAEQGIELSHLQVGMLRILHYENQKTISDLGKFLNLDPSTIVASVDGLERKGFVERQRDPNDRRRVLVVIKDPARDILKQCNIAMESDGITHALENMGTEKTEQLLNSLRNVLEELPEGREILIAMEERLKSHQMIQESLDSDVK
jgi:DNA-binding MarR family transcriptional regulator